MHPAPIDPWLLELIRCPVDHGELRETPGTLSCPQGHSFPVVDRIPLLQHPGLVPDIPPPSDSLTKLAQEPAGRPVDGAGPPEIDAFVQRAIDATNGIMYKGLVGRLQQYPIPRWPLPSSPGKTLLDIGCNWGRWSLSATRSGHRVVGLDPNPEAIFAARRVAEQHGLSVLHVVGDARALPFRAGAFDFGFSYSVLQHLPKPEAKLALQELSRVIHASTGTALVELPNAFGLRSIYHQIRRGFQEPGGFDVRYWTPTELRQTFQELVGATELMVDGFFSINPQTSDRKILPMKFRMVVEASELLKRFQKRVPALVNVADSLYVLAHKE